MKPGEALAPSKRVMPGTTRPSSAVADDEGALIARAAAGDTGAFRVLVERHRARVFALALQVLRSHADAEEVAQDAFVRAWAALPLFRGEARFATWLHRIVLRRALDRAEVLQRRRAREVGDLAGRDFEAPHEHAGGPHEARMQELVDALPRRQREAVTLFYMEDHSVEAAANILGVPENTFKTHLHRARAALRAAWGVREEANT